MNKGLSVKNTQQRQNKAYINHSNSDINGRWRKFGYEEIIARNKTSLDITSLKDKSLADLDNLPDPDVLAEEIAENLESAPWSFREVMRVN